ncbi:type IV pilus modification PilV family protein [Bacillus alkalicellulosilyticus]|uniref:type IV pilus modification PilV family protein n=1 Tax=Alkalihalobacterium alkalicellulosilyticum TaxID=1912214 RepID=UPI0009987C62|nr:prepilin-type N-terminal cleavage/methylation domain-containing protein [Bacillus alkalicellulosilyticus]
MVQKNEKGFTLIELLAAIVILSIIIIVFSGIFTNSFKSNAHTTDSIQAVNIAREMETIIRVDAAKSESLKKFIDNVRVRVENNQIPLIPASHLAKTNTAYSALQLDNNITVVQRSEKREDNTIVQEDYFLFPLSHPEYTVSLYLKAKPDLKMVNKQRSLYRVYIQVESKHGNTKHLSDTYTYIEYKY